MIRKFSAVLILALILPVIAPPPLLYAKDKTQKFTIIYTEGVLGEIEPCG